MKRFIPLALMLLSCRHPAEESSEGKWAHTPGNRSSSVMNARLSFLEQDFKTDFKNLKVCIQNTATYKGSELLLDVKLAYAAWLDASGQGSEDSWKRFEFSVLDRCNMADLTYSSIIVMGSEAKITPDQEVEKTFKRSKVECSRHGFSVNCSTGSTTLGLGGSGGMSFSFFRPEKWESVRNGHPATTILDPYVQWTSLGAGLESMKESAAKKELLDAYKILVTNAEKASYEDLVTFDKKVQGAEAKGGDDAEFQRAMNEFLNGSGSSISKVYVPKLSSFHVLLHEVGHQFGMDHADNPSLDSETGTSGQSEQQNGQWVTKIATMAYAENYFYLTEDDSAGVKDMADKAVAFVKSKK